MSEKSRLKQVTAIIFVIVIVSLSILKGVSSHRTDYLWKELIALMVLAPGAMTLARGKGNLRG